MEDEAESVKPFGRWGREGKTSLEDEAEDKSHQEDETECKNHLEDETEGKSHLEDEAVGKSHEQEVEISRRWSRNSRKSPEESRVKWGNNGPEDGMNEKIIFWKMRWGNN